MTLPPQPPPGTHLCVIGSHWVPAVGQSEVVSQSSTGMQRMSELHFCPWPHGGLQTKLPPSPTTSPSPPVLPSKRLSEPLPHADKTKMAAPKNAQRNFTACMQRSYHASAASM